MVAQFGPRHRSEGSGCGVCESVQKGPPVAPLHPWNWPSQLWQRIHIDHFEKEFYLVVIDSHSKWIDVVPTKSMTASKTIEILRNLFASYGLPEQLFATKVQVLQVRSFDNLPKPMESDMYCFHHTFLLQMELLN